MDITDKKTIRILQYAINNLLSNWDEDCEDDLAFDCIAEKDVKKIANWIDNQIEESSM
jgi:hypothetical protein